MVFVKPHAIGTPEAFMLVRDPIVGIIDDDGYLCEQDKEDPSKPGPRGVPLLATYTDLAAAAGWRWTAVAPKYWTGNAWAELPA